MPGAHVLVPLKRLDEAKTRLAAVLSPAERAELMRSMLQHVLATLREAGGIARITVVTAEQLDPGEGVARWDDRGLPWNEALLAATRDVVTEERVAMVSADLPRLQAEEVEQLLDAVPEHGIAIARAQDGGTNAVVLRPPGAMLTCFGERSSARRHANLARAAGLEAVIVDLPGLAFDVDSPADLALV